MSEAVFEPLSADQSVTEVESLCLSCHKTGVTRLMLTIIPFFKEIVISAFECPHCHFRNSGIQSASEIAPKGITYRLGVQSKTDLDRQLVKSEFATVRLEELDLELPPSSGGGFLTTIEGLLRKVCTDLSATAEELEKDSESSKAVGDIVRRIELFLQGEPFTLVLDDITGNSFIENPYAPKIDPCIKETHYDQDPNRLAELGFAKEEVEGRDVEEIDDAENVHCFRTNCPNCRVPSKTRMTMVDIPYFKEVVIMATSCDSCGYKTNEVKTGGAISEKGKRITLKIEGVEDLSRDILKSETCAMQIPEISLELQMGTLGGRFTTIEGLLDQVYKELDAKVPFAKGDSAPEDKKKIFSRLLEDIRHICEGRLKCTLILEDPLANSYVQNLYAPDPDPQMTVEEFLRTKEQDEDLGILDMKTEDY